MKARFRIATLIGVVAFCGVAFAALRSPSRLWAATVFTTTSAILTASVACVLYTRGARRSFWAGFLLFGGAYHLASLGPWVGDVVSPSLATTALLDLLYPHVAPPPPSANPSGMPAGFGGMGGRGGRGTQFGIAPTPISPWPVWTDPNPNFIGVTAPAQFRRIGHSLLTLPTAVLGGWFARSLQRRRGEP